MKSTANQGNGSKSTSRARSAGSVPFILRAWWLREHQEYKDVNWPVETGITSPLWSLHSDPLCDMGNLDYSYEE